MIRLPLCFSEEGAVSYPADSHHGTLIPDFAVLSIDRVSLFGNSHAPHRDRHLKLARDVLLP